MECQLCHRKDQLVCDSCFNVEEASKNQLQRQVKLTKIREQVTKKLSLIEIQLEIRKCDRQKKIIQIQRMKDRIQQLKEKTGQMKDNVRKLTHMKKILQSNFSNGNLDEGRSLYLQNLVSKNETLNEKIIQCKKQNLKTIQRVMKINKIEQKQYRIQRYYKLENNQHMLFSVQNQARGIPVIKGNNEQVIKYHPFQEKDQTQRKEEQKTVVASIKMSFKIAFVTHKIFLHFIKLPFKLYFFRQYFYLGNLLIIFDKKLAINSESMIKAINMLQADLQYISYVFGYTEKPLLIFNKSFFKFISLQRFKFMGFSTSQRKWNSYLKFLKATNIQEEHNQEIEAPQLIFLRSDDISTQIKKQNHSDQQFEVLQMSQ